MTTAYSCVLIMIIFPYIFTVLAKSGGGYNNHTPREYLEKLTGWRRRAHYVQLNTFEAAPAFGLAVIIAHLTHAHQMTLDNLAIAFVISRAVYGLCYLADKSILRSLAWTAGFACIIWLFVIAYKAS